MSDQLKLTEGKSYTLRNGSVPRKPNGSPFTLMPHSTTDDGSVRVWKYGDDLYTSDGRLFLCSIECPLDIVAEYVPRIVGSIEAINQERLRQIHIKGFTAEHDKQHDGGDFLLRLAIAYASGDAAELRVNEALKYYHPEISKRRNLVKAAALLAAAIDSIDRTRDPTECEHCDGEGEVLVRDPDGVFRRECPHCNGKGKVGHE